MTKKDVCDLAAAATDGAEAYLRKSVRTPCVVGAIFCAFPGVKRATSEALPGIVCGSSVIGFEWSFKHKGTPWQPINVKAVHEKLARRFVYKRAIKIPRQILDAHLVSYTLSHLDHAKLDGFQWALGIASPNQLTNVPRVMRLASLRNSSGYHDFILCARVNATKWVVHPGTYSKRGRRVYHFADLEVVDVAEQAWKPQASKKRHIAGAGSKPDLDCYQLPADLAVYNSKRGEHHGLLATLAVAQLMAFQAEGSTLTQAQGLSRMNFNISTWPPHAHRHMLLLVYRHCSGELRTRNMKRLQEACGALTKPHQTIFAADGVWGRMRNSLATSSVVSLRTRTGQTENAQE